MYLKVAINCLLLTPFSKARLVLVLLDSPGGFPSNLTALQVSIVPCHFFFDWLTLVLYFTVVNDFCFP